ncbi:unnamed protein product [Ascophyllum nodosum]
MDNSSLTQSERESMKVQGFCPTLIHFVKNTGGWIFNLIFAHLLFWLFGFTALLEYGYSDLNQDGFGQIKSGPSGSGVGIITTLLCAAATIIVILKYVSPVVESVITRRKPCAVLGLGHQLSLLLSFIK